MNQLLADPIARKHQRDIAAIVGKRSGSLVRMTLFSVAALVLALFAMSAISGPENASQGLESARRELARSGVLMDREYFQQHQAYREWFFEHGTSTERELFDSVSAKIFRSAASVGHGQESFEMLSFFKRIYVSAHFSVLRITFVVLASWRLWFFALLVTVMLEFFALRVHSGSDLLGQTGNGRLFFSGAQISLEPMNSFGAPETQVRGLVCAPSVSSSVVKKSDVGAVLERYGVANKTNLQLAGVALAHANYPTYVATSEETALLEGTFAGSTLGQSLALILQRALELHQKYRAMQMGSERFDDLERQTNSESPLTQKKLNITEYSLELQRAFHRVLTPEMRTHLAELPAAHLATIILSLEAGKSLAFAQEATGWLRKSNFPQLSARAVLHSMPSYAEDYKFEERSTIRRALIFASRTSVYGPVRFPTDLNDKTRAARQWVELLLACPHELQAVADEVELVGIVGETQRAWSQLFLDGAMALDPDVVDEVYAAPSNVFFMPLTRVLALIRRVTEHGTLRRLEELIARVSQKQRLQAMSLDFSMDTGTGSAERGTLSNAERIFPPLAHREVKTLASEHGVSAADVRDWSSIRIILNSYAWLARRLGDYAVPESSLISVVFTVDPSMPGANAIGRVGKHGMVAFRGTRLESKWGKFWQTRFIPVQGAILAETAHDFEQLMKGIEKSIDEEEPLPLAGPDATKAI